MHSPPDHPGATLPRICRLLPIALLAGALLLPAGFAAPAAHGQNATASALLAQAAVHDRAARKHEKARKKELRRRRECLKKVKKLSDPKTAAKLLGRKAKQLPGAGAKKLAARQIRLLRKRAKKHRKKAARHKRKAKWHRRQAGKLRRQAGLVKPAAAPPAPEPPRGRPRALGAAASWHQLRANSRLASVFLGNFDQLTAENEMKMDALQPTAGQFSWGVADDMVNWARAHGKRVRGHTLIYWDQLPAWVRNGTWSKETLLAVMEDHIKTVVGHFKGRVDEWDVVNEAVDGDGNLARNVWYQAIGPEYVDYAFRFAHEADPSAELFYNDSGIDLPNHPHTLGALNLVTRLREHRVPIDGVGIQGHVTNRFHATEADLAETMRRFVGLDLDVAITEMDVRADGGGSRESEIAAQRRIWLEAARACRRQFRCTSFTTWGIGDSVSWWGAGPMPLLFDEGLNAKQVYGDVDGWIRQP